MAKISGTSLQIVFVIPLLVFAVILGYYSGSPETNAALLWATIAAISVLSFFSVSLSLQLLIVSMLLSPEIGVAQTANREVTIRFDDVILTAMTMSWMLRMAILKDVGFAQKNTLNRPIILFCILAGLSTLLGVWRGDVNALTGFFFVLKQIEYFFLFFMVINYVRDEQTVNQLVTMILVVAGIICLYGLYLIFQGEDVISAPFEGAKGERNTLGGYLALMTGVAGGILIYTRSRFEKRILALGLALGITVLIFSISRSGWIAAIAGTAALFYYSEYKKIFLIVFLGFAIFLAAMGPEVAKKRLEYTFVQTAAGNAQGKIGNLHLDPSSAARLSGYKLAINNLLLHPFLGVGVSAWGFVDGQYFRTLREMGVLGLLLLFWIFIRLHRENRKAIQSTMTPRMHGLAVGFQAGFIGILVHAITANSFIIVRIAEPFWCLAGLVMVAQRLANANPAGDAATDEGNDRQWRFTAARRIVP